MEENRDFLKEDAFDDEYRKNLKDKDIVGIFDLIEDLHTRLIKNKEYFDENDLSNLNFLKHFSIDKLIFQLKDSDLIEKYRERSGMWFNKLNILHQLFHERQIKFQNLMYKLKNGELIFENTTSNLKITSFRDLYNASPQKLKEILFSNWKAIQNKTYHPEGNSLKHIIIVTRRAIAHKPYNVNLILAAYFHDLGKMATFQQVIASRQPTAHGHEKVSAELVLEYSDFIEQMGGNPEIVHYVVENHMRMKPNVWDEMKPKKKNNLMYNPSFDYLDSFAKYDKGGTNIDESDERISLEYLKNIQNNEPFNKNQKLYHLCLKENLNNIINNGLIPEIPKSNIKGGVLKGELFKGVWLTNLTDIDEIVETHFLPKNYYNGILLEIDCSALNENLFSIGIEIPINLISKIKKGEKISKNEYLEQTNEIVYLDIIQSNYITNLDESFNIDEEINAYHGTPYDFDKFDTDKIGTGEGHKSFGWGLYFTEVKDIAEYYAKNIDDTVRLEQINNDLRVIARELRNYEIEGQYRKYNSEKGYELAKKYDQLMDERSQLSKNPKFVYYIKLHKGKTPEQYTWLNWYEKLDKQDDRIKPIIQNLINDYAKNRNILPNGKYIQDNFIFGNDFYQLLSYQYGEKETSLLLLKNGIDGIKYQSNNNMNYNYVVFDSNTVSITKKEFIPENETINYVKTDQNNSLAQTIRNLPFYNHVTEAGGMVYAVGGPVRDFVLNKPSKDLDIIVTKLDIKTLKGILEKYGTVIENLVGGKIAVYKFYSPQTGEVDVALPRTETKIGAGYQGFAVNVDPNLPLEDDLIRRDVRFNAMAMGADGNIIDPYGGLTDLKNREVNATNNKSFLEDALRFLRVINFSTRFKFRIPDETKQLIKKNAERIKEIKPERYIIEFDKLINKGNVLQGIQLLVELNLFQYIFGWNYNGDFKNFDKVKSIGELFYLCSNKDNFSFDNVINAFNARFGSALDGDSINQIKCLLYLHDLNNNKVHNLFVLQKMCRVSCQTIENSLLIPEEIKKLSISYPMNNQELAINGNEIMALGFKGKEIGEIIIEIYKAIYSDKLKNEKQAIIDFIKKEPEPLPDDLNETQLPIDFDPNLNNLNLREYLSSLRRKEKIQLAKLLNFKNILYHGTDEWDIDEYNVELGFKFLHGLYCSHDYRVSIDYGDNTLIFGVKDNSKILDLSDGDYLLNFVTKNEIFDSETLNDPDFKNKLVNGDIFQIFTRRGMVSDYVNHILEFAEDHFKYDIVKMIDNLGGKGDNIAYIVLNKECLIPFDELIKNEYKANIKIKEFINNNKVIDENQTIEKTVYFIVNNEVKQGKILSVKDNYYNVRLTNGLETFVKEIYYNANDAILKLTPSLNESISYELQKNIKIEYHKKLNQKIWNKDILRRTVRNKLLKLTDFFISKIGKEIKIKDIIFTGSLANYNYTKQSDIDIHIVIDYTDISDDKDFVQEFFLEKKRIWQEGNDIKIFNFPVEIFVQDQSQLDSNGMSAMYSIKKDKWEKKPKYNVPDMDKEKITKKINEYIKEINQIENMKNNENKINKIISISDKIKNNRHKDVAKYGEFSTGNLVFKILRNKKILDKLTTMKKEAVTEVYSLNENKNI